MLKSRIDDPSLAGAGAERIKWYRDKMDVVRAFRERYERERPFAGKRLLVCMHCEPKAAVRTEALLAGGAEGIVFVGNLGSTKPDTAAYLASLPEVTVLARQNDTLEDLQRSVAEAMAEPFDLLMDNGAALMQQFWRQRGRWSPLGAIEETRSGRLILDREGICPDFPVLVIDDSPVKRLVENEVGVGQSVVDGFMRATSMLIGGKRVLIIGYGWCGTGIAQRFRALGAVTMVYDTDPLRLLKAKLEGHIVGRLEELLAQADVVCTVTGRFGVIGESELRQLRDGAVLCNAGHYNMEIDTARLGEIAQGVDAGRRGEVFRRRKAHLSAAKSQSAESGLRRRQPHRDNGAGLRPAAAEPGAHSKRPRPGAGSAAPARRHQQGRVRAGAVGRRARPGVSGAQVLRRWA